VKKDASAARIAASAQRTAASFAKPTYYTQIEIGNCLHAYDTEGRNEITLVTLGLRIHLRVAALFARGFYDKFMTRFCL